MTIMNVDYQKWIKIRDESPFIGMAIYGKSSDPIIANDIISFSSTINNELLFNKFNSVSFWPWEKIGNYGYRNMIEYMLRGKKVEELLTAIGDRSCEWITVSQVPLAKLRAFLQMFLSSSIAMGNFLPVSRLEFGCLYNDKENAFRDSSSHIFEMVLNREKRSRAPKYGFIQVYQGCCEVSIMPQRKYDSNLERFRAAPLIATIANSRSKGDIAKLTSYEWNGEPFNLYWGNLISREIADKIDLESYLVKEIGMKIENSISVCSSDAHLVKIGEDFIFFALSGDPMDSLAPDNGYIKRYNKILKYLLNKNIVYPGLDDEGQTEVK